jgi:hypothetical protein
MAVSIETLIEESKPHSWPQNARDGLPMMSTGL